MNIEEAIAHAREVAEGCPAEDRQCAYQHDELADWLEELKAYRKLGEWIYGHVEMHNPELTQKFEAVEKALGFKLFVWQKAFIAWGKFRRMGATTAEILRNILDVSALPIDYSEPERNFMERFYRRELREIKLKLDEAGIPTRTVFFSKKDKWEYFADKGGEINAGRKKRVVSGG